MGHGNTRAGISVHAQSSERGAALVEFGLVSVLFFTVIFAIVQGGILFGSWLVVTNAAREGARYASVCISRAEMPQAAELGAYCEGDAGWASHSGAVTRITQYTKSRIVWPNPDDGAFSPPGFSTGLQFNDTDFDAVGAGDPRLVRVVINYGVPLLAPMPSFILPNPMPLSAQSDMRIEE